MIEQRPSDAGSNERRGRSGDLPATDVAAALVLVVSLAFQIAAFHDLRNDDAFITYRYGQNLVTGHGPVFNPGERLLGSTSPGQILLSAAAYGLLGLEATPDAMAVVSCLAWTAQAAAVYVLLAGVLARWAALAVALAVALGAAGSASWVPLETNPTTALVLWAFVAARRGRWTACAILCALAFVMRPDAFLATIVLGVAAAVSLRGRVLGPAAAYAAVAAPWYLFATVYYGSPLPRTAIAKFQRTDLPEYFLHVVDAAGSKLFPLGHALVPLVVAWLLALWGVHVLARRGAVFAWLACYVALHAAAYLVMRPYVQHAWHLYPLVICFVVFGLSAIAHGVQSGPLWVKLPAALLGLALLTSYGVHALMGAATHHEDYWAGGRYTAYRRTVEFLLANARPGDVFASVEVGTIAYYSDMRAADLGTLVSTPEAVADPTKFQWAVVDRSDRHFARGLTPVFHTSAGGFDVWVYDLTAARHGHAAAQRR